MEEQKAKALFAGGVALFVTGLVVLMLLVIPAARQTQVAMAQEDMDMPPDPAMQGMPVDDGMPPDMMMDPAMMGGDPSMAGAPAAEAPPAPEGAVAPPLEPSRPNPFAPRVTVGPDVVDVAAMPAPRYGPDWSQLPIAERVAFVRPDVPPAPVPPLPQIDRQADGDVRVTSILWDATGGALAAYEDAAGQTGELRPGDRVPGTAMTVQEITRTGVTLENPRTGESQVLEIRPRTERREQPRQQRQPRVPRGGFPDAPPGG